MAEDEAKQEEAPPATDPVRRVTRWVLGLALLLFVWYLAADRYTPYTHQAYLVGAFAALEPWGRGRAERDG